MYSSLESMKIAIYQKVHSKFYANIGAYLFHHQGNYDEIGLAQKAFYNN